MSVIMCNCPSCGQEISVDENLIGVEFSCPMCSEPVLVQADEEQETSAGEAKSNVAPPKLKIPKPKIKIPAAKRQMHNPGKTPHAPQITPPVSDAAPPVTEKPVVFPPSENHDFSSAPGGGFAPPPASNFRMDDNQNYPPEFKGYAPAPDNGRGAISLTPLVVLNVLILLVAVCFFASYVWGVLGQRELSEKQQKQISSIANQVDKQTQRVSSIAIQVDKQTAFLSTLALPNYEYKVVEVSGVGLSDTSSKQILSDEIQNTLNRFNDWELVDVVTEIETKFPNFGNGGYVTGIKSNTRTCRAHLILRKRR